MRIARFASITIAAALAASAVAPLVASAQPAMKTGLWEAKTKIGGNPQMEQAMAQMQKQLAAMPPAQRKQMEEMMSKQGVQLGADGTTARMCLTKEQFERKDWMSQEQRRGDCKTTRQDHSGSTYSTAWTCANPPSTGEAQVVVTGDDGYRSKVVINRTMGGKPETMTIEGTSRWLSADCGAIKPFVPPVAAAK